MVRTALLYLMLATISLFSLLVAVVFIGGAWVVMFDMARNPLLIATTPAASAFVLLLAFGFGGAAMFLMGLVTIHDIARDSAKRSKGIKRRLRYLCR
jgi:uncharacterized membrane protein